MRWIFESIIGILQWFIAGALDAIGEGVIEVLTLNIGANAGGTYVSAFDVVFRSVFTFYKGFQVFALGMLAVNFIWQLIKIMVSRDGVNETPFALVARTFTAGIAIGMSAQIVSIAQQFFAVLYNALLNTGSRSSFALAINADLGSTIDGLISAVIGLGFSILIGWEFIMFLAEVVERYIILGVLFYTSPLAFAMAGSKSTGSVFTSWVRMVLSQMMLMCFNVFFYKLFLQGYSAYGDAMTGLSEVAGHVGLAVVANRAGLTMLWNLMMFAILHVGTRMDSYMATLGLSTAQAGRGLGVAVTSAFSSAVRTAATAGMVMKAASAPARKAIGKARENYQDNHQAPTRDKAGNWSADTISKVASGKSAVSELSGKDVGAAFMQPNSPFASVLEKAGADLNTAKVSAESRRVSMSTRPDANGKSKGIDMIPVTDPEMRKALQKQQAKFGEVGGVEYAMIVHGSQNDRAELLAGGPEMNKANKDWENGSKGRSVESIKDAHGDLTGGYHCTQRDKNGDIKQSFDILPSSMFDGDTVPPEAKLVKWGGQDCYQVDTTARDTAKNGLEFPLNASDAQRTARACNGEFSSPAVGQPADSGGLDLESAKFDKGGIIEGVKADGTRVGLAPAADFRATEGIEGAQLRQADNGASYIEVPLGQDEKGAPISAASAFQSVPKDAQGQAIGTVTGPTSDMTASEAAGHFQSQMGEPIRASSAAYDDQRGMWTTTTEAHTGSDGQPVPEQRFAYASASQYRPVDSGREGISTVASKDGEMFYKVPLQTGESAQQVFSAQGESSHINTPNVGAVNPIDTMSTARQNFQGGQLDSDMTHCEAIQGGGMRCWNPQTGQQQFVLPTSAFTSDMSKRYVTSTQNQSYMVIDAAAGASLSDVAQEKGLDSQGRHLSARMNLVPEIPKTAPQNTDNVRRGAWAKKKK